MILDARYTDKFLESVLASLGIDNPEDLTPRQRETAFANIFARLISDLLEIEQQHRDRGSQRTAGELRGDVAECIAVLSSALKRALALTADGGFRLDLPAEGRFWGSYPFPLYILFNELCEIDQGRPSLLLSHKLPETGRSGLQNNLLRVAARAAAAAALHVLLERGLGRAIAAQRISTALSECGFNSPRKHGGPYAPGTIIDWRKNATKLNKPFPDLFEKLSEQMRGVARVAEHHLPPGDGDEGPIFEAVLDVMTDWLRNISYRP
ncbi:hypothetical protein MnTg02_01652 [bacterium MnTg02]|nr:hypothetical protein MnTg02_01652 [bacterium MnTg02]